MRFERIYTDLQSAALPVMLQGHRKKNSYKVATHNFILWKIPKEPALDTAFRLAEAPFPLIGPHVGDYSFCIDELVAPEGAFLFYVLL